MDRSAAPPDHPRSIGWIGTTALAMDLDRDDAGDAGLIVEAIVNMARGRRVHVVAEGIETAGHAERLRALGCTSGQGWLYAKPLPPEDVPALIGRPLIAAAWASPGQPATRIDPAPESPRRSFVAAVRSNSRPPAYGPRSTTGTRTVRPPWRA